MPPADEGKRFAGVGGLKLGPSLPPGESVLQVAAKAPDPKSKRKVRATVQRIDFEVR